MLPSKRLLLLAALACVTLLCASLVAPQNQQLNNSNVAAPVLRRVVVRHLGSFDTTMQEEASTRVGQTVYRPRVEMPYDQDKADNMKKALQELWKARGVSVNVFLLNSEYLQLAFNSELVAAFQIQGAGEYQVFYSHAAAGS